MFASFINGIVSIPCAFASQTGFSTFYIAADVIHADAIHANVMYFHVSHADVIHADAIHAIVMYFHVSQADVIHVDAYTCIQTQKKKRKLLRQKMSTQVKVGFICKQAKHPQSKPFAMLH